MDSWVCWLQTSACLNGGSSTSQIRKTVLHGAKPSQKGHFGVDSVGLDPVTVLMLLVARKPFSAGWNLSHKPAQDPAKWERCPCAHRMLLHVGTPSDSGRQSQQIPCAWLYVCVRERERDRERDTLWLGIPHPIGLLLAWMHPPHPTSGLLYKTVAAAHNISMWTSFWKSVLLLLFYSVPGKQFQAMICD